MILVKLICDDDFNRPSNIPYPKWIEKDKKYHAYKVIKDENNNIKGVDLIEMNASDYISKDSFYNLSRFSIQKKELHKLVELANESNIIKKITLEDILEQTNINII